MSSEVFFVSANATADFKSFRRAVENSPFASLIITTNHPPRSPDQGIGTARSYQGELRDQWSKLFTAVEAPFTEASILPGDVVFQGERVFLVRGECSKAGEPLHLLEFSREGAVWRGEAVTEVLEKADAVLIENGEIPHRFLSDLSFAESEGDLSRIVQGAFQLATALRPPSSGEAVQATTSEGLIKAVVANFSNHSNVINVDNVGAADERSSVTIFTDHSLNPYRAGRLWWLQESPMAGASASAFQVDTEGVAPTLETDLFPGDEESQWQDFERGEFGSSFAGAVNSSGLSSDQERILDLSCALSGKFLRAAMARALLCVEGGDDDRS